MSVQTHPLPSPAPCDLGATCNRKWDLVCHTARGAFERAIPLPNTIEVTHTPGDATRGFPACTHTTVHRPTIEFIAENYTKRLNVNVWRGKSPTTRIYVAGGVVGRDLALNKVCVRYYEGGTMQRDVWVPISEVRTAWYAQLG